MARITLLATALVIALAGAWSGGAWAQTDTRDRTFMTFSGPVEMPGVTLPGGTYVFKLADTPGRNVVEVWDRDEKHMVGHWLFVQAERPLVSQDTVVMFKETAAGTTPAVQYWYYPGEKTGKEFVYPKNQALKLAQRTQAQVLSTDGEITAQSSVSSVDASGQVTEWTREKSTASNGSQGPGVVDFGVAPQREFQQARGPEARDVQVSAAQPAPAPRPAPEPARTAPLPQTASPLALSGLVGLISLAGAAGIRFLR
jgi:hypothetical protein